MSEIEEYERRLAMAFERISYSVERLSTRAPAAAAAVPAPSAPAAPAAPAADPAEVAALKSALDDERLANAQLEERVKAIRSKQDTQVSALETKVRGQKEVLARLEGELSRLRQATEALRASNLALREANEAGVGKPELINDGLRAELESLHAERAAERAEVETVLALMTPLLEDAAAGGTTDTEEMA